MAKKGGLGSSLENLQYDMNAVYGNAYDMLDSNKVRLVSIDEIVPNPHQPRKNFDKEALQELADSIKEHGLLQPIIITKDYVLIAGERRLRACKLAGLDEIRAIVVSAEEHNMRELAIIENIQREELNPIELANSYKALIDEHNITHEELSQKLAKSRSQITNTLRLLELDSKIQELIMLKKLTQGHAKMLVGLDSNLQNIAAQSILGQKLSVRDTESFVKKLKEGKENNGIESTKTSRVDSMPMLKLELLELEKLLKQDGILTRIKDNAITLSFENKEAVQGLASRLKGG